MATTKEWVDRIRDVMQEAEVDGVIWNGAFQFCEDRDCPGHRHDFPLLYMQVRDDDDE